MDWTERVADNIRAGIVSILSTQISTRLTWMHGFDLFLVLVALFRISRYGSKRRLPVISRVLKLMDQVLIGIMLKLVLRYVTATDRLQTLANVMAVFLFSAMFRQARLSGASQYIFADTIVAQLNQWPDSVLPAVVFIHCLSRGVGPRVHETLDTLTMRLLTSWLAQSIPSGMSVPTSVLLVYLLSSLASRFPAATSLYSYALYSGSSGWATSLVEPWLQGVACLYLWKMGPDKVARSLGQMTSVGFFSSYSMQSVTALAVTDPVLATLVVALTTSILLEYTQQS